MSSIRYVKQERIGSGSYGYVTYSDTSEVFRCLDTKTRDTVAAKIVSLELSADELLTIQREISMLQQVRHPCITPCYDSFVESSDLWIIMEYCAGGSCSDLVRAHTLQERYIAIILRELLRALVYIHAEQKIHRDIKAANILLHKDGSIRLADFGVAGQLHAQAKRVNSFVGTPYWMGPEVVKQSGYTTSADIWSVGITAIELAQGEPPYADLHPMKVLHLIPRNPPPQLPKTYSSAFRDFVAQCLTRDPLKRPSAAQLLKHAFIRKAGSTKELAPLAKARPPKVRKAKQAAPTDPSEAPLWDFASLRPSLVEPADGAAGGAPAAPEPEAAPRPSLWKQTYRTLLGRSVREPPTPTSHVVQFDGGTE
ncbi:non-specific serine/threonine protein kinase [Malassezia caprae]|uniref:non-specific serine/threonine protein kinase n=1 Tax=Malassezia caprae TaxID=1381934 RepID=A0AAF0E8F2_9BASI|nr:non-specific serine/threonine protein kinase [Malassezia caprae]